MRVGWEEVGRRGWGEGGEVTTTNLTYTGKILLKSCVQQNHMLVYTHSPTLILATADHEQPPKPRRQPADQHSGRSSHAGKCMYLFCLSADLVSTEHLNIVSYIILFP